MKFPGGNLEASREGVFQSFGHKDLHGEVQFLLVLVELDGEFPGHKPSHAHVLYFLRGRGECWVGSRSYQAKPGDVALPPKDEEHGYRSTGKEDLLLLVVNFPATR